MELAQGAILRPIGFLCKPKSSLFTGSGPPLSPKNRGFFVIRWQIGGYTAQRRVVYSLPRELTFGLSRLQRNAIFP
jgi:hypothetical protein